MRGQHESQADGGLVPGTRVEVHCRYDRRWAPGFEVVSVDQAGYRLRRLSDGVELPATFVAADVRAGVPSPAV
jgi:hypothetical protein